MKIQRYIRTIIYKASKPTIVASIAVSVILCFIASLTLPKYAPYSFIATFFTATYIVLTFLLVVLLFSIINKIKNRDKIAFLIKRNQRIQEDFKNGKVINVAFLCDSPAYWTSFSDLYYLMKNDESFNVQLVVIPEYQNGNRLSTDSMSSFLESSHLNYIDYKKFKKQLHNNMYHYVFPSRPYDHVRPYDLSNKTIKKYAKLCHIPYGTCTFDGKTLDTVCGFQNLRHYDFVFSETNDHSQIYEEKKKRYPLAPTKIVTVGSPKFDYIFHNDFKKDRESFKQVILYTPRWTTYDGSCSFLETYEHFFDLVKNNSEVKYIFRPHPLMKNHFINSVWSEKGWESFINEFESYSNAEIDLNASYIDSFRKATVLVSDMSSLLPEFLLTKKPVIYYHKINQFNIFGQHLLDAYYICQSWNEVNNVLLELRQGNDPRASKREQIINKYFCFEPKSSVLIKKCLKDDYMSIYSD